MHLKGPAKVLGLYLLFSATWIITTDIIFGEQIKASLIWSSLKGLVYVALSGAILFWLCRGLVLEAHRLERTVSEIFRQSEFGVFLGSEGGILVDCNEAFAEMLGFSVDELIGRKFSELVHREDASEALSDWVRSISQNSAPSYVRQRRYMHRDGHAVWVRLAVSQIRSKQRQMRLLVGLSQDVSVEVAAFHALERQRSELAKMLESVQRSEARFKQLVESIQTGIMVGKSDGSIREANSVLLRMLGYDREELEEGKIRWDSITPSKYLETDRRMLQMLRETGRIPSYEKEYVTRDGSVIPILISAGKVSEEDDGSVEAVVSVVDLREVKRKDAELSRLARAVECASEGIVITDTENRFVYANDAFERMTGYARNEIIGKTPSILKSGKTTVEEYERLWETLTRGENWKGRFWNKKKDGNEYLEDTTITPVRDNQGKIINYLAVKRDITREHAMEKRLVQSQRLEAVGQLASGVAHDLNNILQVVHSSAELAMRRKGDAAYTEKKLTDVVTASKRGAGIIRQLLMFTRGELPAPKLVELNTLIRETGTMLKRLLPEDIEIVTEFEQGLTSVEADPVRVSQVLMNLAVNSRDAMPYGGILTVGTRRLIEQGQTYVRLTVSDTGMGMDEQTQTKIFEPFFTTKEPGKGTGLGLATVQEIAEQSRARLSVESKLGRGSSFHMDFPAAEEQPSSHLVDPQYLESNDVTLNGSVLVCEDDESVRSAICEYLEAAGLKVLRCSNANEAREAVTMVKPAILITDLIMPGQSGVQLGNELQQQIENLKVLLITGHTEHALLREAKAEKSFAFLQKPFSAASLMERLRSFETRIES